MSKMNSMIIGFAILGLAGCQSVYVNQTAPSEKFESEDDAAQGCVVMPRFATGDAVLVVIPQPAAADFRSILDLAARLFIAFCPNQTFTRTG
jgi:hypothetical protein